MENDGSAIPNMVGKDSTIDAFKESGIPPGVDTEKGNEKSGNGSGAVKITKEDMLNDFKSETVKHERTPDKTPEKEKLPLKKRLEALFKKKELEFEPYDPEKHGPIVTFDGMEGHEETDRYWVNEPYAFVVILHNTNRDDLLYQVVEPRLVGLEEEFLEEIRSRLRDVLLVEKVEEDEDKEEILVKKVKSLVQDYAIDIDVATLEKILYYIVRDFIGFGKLDPMMHDSNIEDISANGYDIPIYLYHIQYLNIPTSVIYGEEELDSFIIRLAQRSGKHISIAEPMVDAAMPDGSRIQMTLGEAVTAHGSTFTIRKFKDVPITPVDLVNWNTFSSEAMAYLWLCIENNKSLIFAGGTASGKTSSLNAVAL